MQIDALYFCSGGQPAVDRAVFDLNRDDYTGIRNAFNGLIWWNAEAKHDFQSAMDNALQEREFCVNETVSFGCAFRCVLYLFKMLL